MVLNKLDTLKFKLHNSSLDIHMKGEGMMTEYKSIGISQQKIMQNRFSAASFLFSAHI